MDEMIRSISSIRTFIQVPGSYRSDGLSYTLTPANSRPCSSVHPSIHAHYSNCRMSNHNPRGLSSRKRPRSVEPVTALSLLHRQQPTAAAVSNSSSFTGAALLQHPQWQLFPGTITEIAGPAGVGKTQMALTLCADSVMLHQKAVYIALGGGSSSSLGMAARRLRCMLVARLRIHGSKATRALSDEVIQQQYLRNVFFQWVRNTEEFMELLRLGLPRLLDSHQHPSAAGGGTRVVVLDGIANLFRHAEHHEYILDRNYWQERSSTFFQLSTLCKMLSEKYQVPFVILNQATTRIQDEGIPSGRSTNSYDTSTTSRLEPALGLSWRQCINASFFIDNTDSMIRSSNNDPTQPPDSSSAPPLTRRRRRMVCLKSPRVSSQAVIEFYIDPRGTVRLTDDNSSHR